MFGESLDLASVLNRLKRADEALTECIAPLWPGVQLVAAWMEHAPHLFHLRETPPSAGYFMLGTREDTAHVIREADPDDAQRYRNYLERAAVILLNHDLAYPASFAERLQGITKPRPIHFAPLLPLQQVVARFDGINLFFERIPGETTSSPIDDLFNGNTIFTPGELLGVPGEASANDAAAQAQQALDDDPKLLMTYQLTAVLEPAGGVLDDWSAAEDGIHLRWRRADEAGEITLPSPVSPITSGICLPGAQRFDLAALTRLLISHALDAWR
jgi:hypothetical protein